MATPGHVPLRSHRAVQNERYDNLGQFVWKILTNSGKDRQYAAYDVKYVTQRLKDARAITYDGQVRAERVQKFLERRGRAKVNLPYDDAAWDDVLEGGS